MRLRKLCCYFGFIVALLINGIPLRAQPPVIVTGTVHDDNSQPVAGATVVAVNTTDTTLQFTTSTNAAGIFRFNQLIADQSYHIRVSYVGFLPQSVNNFDIKRGESNSIFIKLQPAATTALDEVVVVGYGTQKKINVTGAVNQVKGDEFRDRPVTNISQMLQGAIPNLNIGFSGGAPGTMGSLNVRGVTSVNLSLSNPVVSGGPLVIIDGVPGTLDRLSPEEVETITVLKDAASAAIYGARAAFGVVLVTTKNGRLGKTAIRYNNSFGFATPTVSTDFITTGYDWMKLNDAALAHVGGYSRYTEQDYAELYARRNDKTEDPSRPWITVQNRNGRDQYVYYGNYDWWDIMFTKWQPNQNHNLNISGGNEKVQYMLNGNMKLMDGIMRMHTDKYSSYNIRSKVTAQLNKWLKISQNMNFYNSNYLYYGRQDGGNANFSSINVHASPAYAPYNPDGTPFYITGLNSYDIADGAFLLISSGTSKGAERKYELNSITEAVITPFRNMNITANYTYRMFTDPSFYRITPGVYSLYPGVVDTASRYRLDKLTEDQQFNQMHVINIFGDYTWSFNRIHHFKIIAGFNQELYRNKKITASKQDLADPDLNDFNLASGIMEVAGGSSELALRGYFYRLNYDYKGKYLLETNGRYDGSSRFANGRNFAFAPSVSLGWRASEEGFFKPVKKVVSDLKLRGSVGSLGNQEAAGGFYPYILSSPTGSMSYILDGQRANYVRYPTPVSADITWEKVTTYNGGIDIGFLKNRLNISFDRYIRETKGFLAEGYDLPNVFGTAAPLMNVGEMRTQGFELSVNWQDRFELGGKPFRYSIGGVLGDNYSRITKVIKDSRLTYSYYKGKTIGEIWGYITDGYFQTDAEARTYPVDQSFLNRVRIDNNIPIRAGDLRWVDLNGDGVISANPNTVEEPGDQRVIGNTTPRYSYSFNGRASWGGIDVSVYFQGLGKKDWYPGNNADRFWGPYSRPYFSFIPKDFEKDIYSADNPNAYFPNLLAYVALNANNELRAANNKYLQDLAYLRLKNLTIGYSLPNTLMKRVGLSSFRVFVSGENLVTWTKLRTKYIDPEQAMANQDGRVYPFSKVYSFGIDISL
ncbi:SusC/RagA family TonB-linked outer membrane protein [Niabella aquatica]